MRVALDATFARPLPQQRAACRVTGERRAVLSVRLRGPQRVSVIDLREDVAQGQRVSAWSLVATGATEAVFARGTTIGFRQLRRIAPTTVDGLQLRIETVDEPQAVSAALYA